MEPDRRRLLQMMAAALVADTTPAAGPVKWSTGTELPKLKAPAHACDCHHYLYDSRYPVDRRGIMFPGNASIADYRALQRRLGITRQVVVQPSAYGVDNRPVLAALAALGREARGVVVVDENISDAELRRMHERGVRAIQFNFAPPGPTTPAPMSKSRPSGSSGAPTGRIRAKIPNPTMRCFSTCCLVGRPTRKCGTASWSKTLPRFTIFRRSREHSAVRRRFEAQAEERG